jgi:hypothetical protein
MNLYRGLGVLVVLLSTTALVSGQDTVSFAGKWAGKWHNSLGETGTDTLDLKEDEEGKVSGTWTEGIRVTGKRVNKNTIEFQAKTTTLSYQATATVKGGTMTVKYLATRLGTEGAYDGSATLKRAE